MRLSLQQCVTLACLLEATAPKPGNVHRAADFEDMTFVDFQASAVAIGPVLQESPGRSLGQTVLLSVQATRHHVKVNTNLGTILLLAPLAKATVSGGDLQSGISTVLSNLTSEDSAHVYEAIRLVNPGGLGESKLDVADQAPDDLLSAMRLAEERDLVARQYTNEFEQVFQVSDHIASRVHSTTDGLTDAIIYASLALQSEHPDSLIARKCGVETAKEASTRAAECLDLSNTEHYHTALADFDFWLRSDGHRRNPGTTADIIAAALFVGLWDHRIQPPYV